jgi:hypothetical protein
MQTSFSTPSDGMAAWGLKNNNLTFVRRDLRTALYKYISRGEAVVEFD